MLRTLDETANQPLVLVVEGESGVGKTTLVHEFCRRLETDSNQSALVCRGSCSERESVPFKALDAIAEHLAQRYPSIVPSDARIAANERSAALAEDRLQRAVGLAQSCGMRIIGCAHGDDTLLSQVKRPDRWAQMIAPGLSLLAHQRPSDPCEAAFAAPTR